jgi:exonuclease III
LIKWDKEGHYIPIKGKIYQKEITIINLYAPNASALNFIKHTLKVLKAYIDSKTVVVGDFNFFKRRYFNGQKKPWENAHHLWS